MDLIKVLAIGCFDLLHPGHIAHLQEAKELGNYLIVGLTMDKQVKKEKGIGHPLFSWAERAYMLAALRLVDEIYPHRNFDETVMSTKPNILVKGMDWKGDMPAEEEFLKYLEIKLVFLDTQPVYSSSRIMRGEEFNERSGLVGQGTWKESTLLGGEDY